MVEFSKIKLKVNTLPVRQDASLRIVEGVHVEDAMLTLSKQIVVLTVMEILRKITPETTGKELEQLLTNLDVS